MLKEWPAGLPMKAVMASMPWRSRTPWRSSSQRAKASGQLASRQVSPSRIIGTRMRSGSSWSLPRVVPFGQM